MRKKKRRGEVQEREREKPKMCVWVVGVESGEWR